MSNEPHISLAPERLIKRVLGLPLEEFQTWPGYLQDLALSLSREIFIIRYNPLIPAQVVRKHVFARLAGEQHSLTPEYFSLLSGCLERYWQSYEQDEVFKYDLVQRLQKILPKHLITTEPHKLIEMSTDATDLRMELPAIIISPDNEAQIVAVIRLASELGFPIIPRGGGSGLTGGAVPAKSRAVVMSMGRFKKILDINAEEMTIRLQTGVITSNAIEAANKIGALLTIDPASKTASSIGGNIAENAGGPCAFEYGTTLDVLLNYHIVMSDGELLEVCRKNHPRHKITENEIAIFEVYNSKREIIKTIKLPGSAIRKSNLGKDVTNKALGGLPGVQKEGTDGIISEATFILYPKLQFFKVLCMEFFGTSMRNAMQVIKKIVALRDKIRDDGDLVKISALEEFNVKYVQAIQYRKKSLKYEGEPISVLIIQLDSNHLEALELAVQSIMRISQAHDGVDVLVAKDALEAEEYWHDRHQLSAIARHTSGFKINEDIVIPLEVIPEFSDFLENLNLYYLAFSYREALIALQGLSSINPADEFIQMELEIASSLCAGKITKDDIPEQTFELQIFYFFHDLISRYKNIQEKIEGILSNLKKNRLIIASHMHAGDGNCHVNIPVNSNDLHMLELAEEAAGKVFEQVLSLGGAISGEHGIGITKIDYLEDEKIESLRQYKHEVDPNNLFNPGKLTQRTAVVTPYTFSFNHLIQAINRTDLPGKEHLLHLLSNIQACTRCGKCKQVCPMYIPQFGFMYHPRNKNIALGAMVEALYYMQMRTGELYKPLLKQINNVFEHCTTCGKCYAVCPLKIKTHELTLDMRYYLSEKQVDGHPLKKRVLELLSENPQKRVPTAAALANFGQKIQNTAMKIMPSSWRRNSCHPLLGRGPNLESGSLLNKINVSAGSILCPKNSDPKKSVLYFPGCGSSLFYKSIGFAGIYLLLDAGYTVVLPSRHLCCGFPLLSAGGLKRHEVLSVQNKIFLEKTLEKLQVHGVLPKYLLTSCGTCRSMVKNYDLKQDNEALEQFDLAQFVLEKTEKMFDLQGTTVLYHTACHSEWHNISPLKGGQIYATILAKLFNINTIISPYCCAESGMGALSSPRIYNRLRLLKKEILTKNFVDYPEIKTVLVGCPSCKIGIKRCLIGIDKNIELLHTTEFLAKIFGGDNWQNIFLNALNMAKTDGIFQIIDLQGSQNIRAEI